MIQITCTCKTCTDEAAKRGVTALGANVPDANWDSIPANKRTSKALTHNLVHIANDKGAVNVVLRERTGIRPL